MMYVKTYVCDNRCCCAGMCEGLIKLNRNGITETKCKGRMYKY